MTLFMSKFMSFENGGHICMITNISSEDIKRTYMDINKPRFSYVIQNMLDICLYVSRDIRKGNEYVISLCV